MSVKLSELLQSVRKRLEQAGSDNPGQEARLIIEHFAQINRTMAVLNPEFVVGDDKYQQLEIALQRRLSGEPVYRILGQREFYGLPLKLSADTLEPRPDTETLVDLVLPHACKMIEQTGQCRILDIGTGTGAIALALLSQLPEAIATGVDISVNALETASENADINNLGNRFHTLQSDWLSNIDGEYDLVVSNPPYISTKNISTLDIAVRNYDPLRALDGGEDGLYFYRLTSSKIRSYLSDNGMVAVEIGSTQKQQVQDIFSANSFVMLASACDIEGRDRALLFTFGDKFKELS